MDPPYIPSLEHQEDSPNSADETLREEAGPQKTHTPFQASASSAPKSTSAKPGLKSLPTVRDHTTDELGPGGDEYLPREIDHAGEKKVIPNGVLCGGREYRCRTFCVPGRGDKLFMLATECARVLGYRDSYLLFNKNRSLYKIIASPTDKDDMISQEILPFSYRSRQIAIVTAKSIFRQFGSRVIVGGRRLRDDYWETKARKQGFTEADLAGDKRPGASRAREKAASDVPEQDMLHLMSHLGGYPGTTDTGRPAFILYRNHHEPEVVAEYPGLEALDVSKRIWKFWSEETQEVRDYWKCRAEAYGNDSGIFAENAPPEMVNTGTAAKAFSDIRGKSAHAYGDEPFIPKTFLQAVAASPEQTQSYRSSAEWPPILESRVGMDPSDSSRTKLSPKPSEGLFDHFLALWLGAETTGQYLDLLQGLGNHRPATLPKAVSVRSMWQGWLRCEWEFPSVVREMRESKSDEVQSLLESFVVITGNRSNMESSTCGQFLKKHWRESGTRALEILSQGVASVNDKSAFLPYLKVLPRSKTNPAVEIQVNDTHIIIKVGRDQPDAQSFIEAIVWACTAVRINPQRQGDSGKRSQLQVSKATPLISYTSPYYALSSALVYGLEPLTACSDKDIGPQGNCWTRLFTSGTIAFHPLLESWAVGLEIEFDMMVHLSGVENVYHIDGGIILLGFLTALVPISYDKDTNIVQWHFEEVSGLSGGILKPRSLASVRGKWYKTEDINMLRSSKCFLGWFARANILLGTRQLVESATNMLKWSTGTKEHHQSVRREGFEAAGQLGFTAGPINTNLQLVRTWRFHSNVQQFHRHEQYSTALRLGRGNVAVIIDSESKQVWLVPMLSVVLHLCHRYFQEVNHDSQTNNPLPFADSSPDGASEAARVLESSGEVVVFGVAGNPDSENLRQLFLRINTNLLNASGTREPSNKNTLFASELMAMITEPGRGSPLKEIPAPADADSWVGLLERVDFVGVCANIGHLIEPEPPSGNPCICSALPSDRYFLAAHMRCLDALSKRAGDGISTDSLNKACRLGDTVFWNAEQVHWTNCPADIHDPIWNAKENFRVLQQISRKEKGKGKNVSGLNGQAVPQRDLPEDGAVVFGGNPSRRTIQSRRFSEYILQGVRRTPA